MPYHPVRKKIIRRAPAIANPHLDDQPPLLQRIYAARQVRSASELDRSLSQLPAPQRLSGMDTMTALLAEAIRQDRSLLVIGDYDADGATASAVAVRGLRALGLRRVSFLVPNRFEYGYGLTPDIVALAARQSPDILLTVDNGISSLDGVAAAKALGMQVLVTDHHLPGVTIPMADAIVNPNLPGDEFPSQALAGVGVMFYVLMALRQRLREGGHFGPGQTAEPNLGQLLDLVALGTVADVVPLDHVNRILVHQGMQRIRAGQAQPGLLAILESAGRKPHQVTATDLGFFIGPRLNAAGRIDDMSLGIECLLTDNPDTAREMATVLNEMNRERRGIEDQMKLEALASLKHLDDIAAPATPALSLFREDWHPGVVGLVASRVKDRFHRPVIAFAPADPQQPEQPEIKGSGRSIPGIHLRDVLADIATRHPGLIDKYGGHAMAAGLSLDRERLESFGRAFEEAVECHAANLDLEHAVHTDGPLDHADMAIATAELLQDAGPWGQGFPEPLFDGQFKVTGSRIVGDKHLKLMLRPAGSTLPIDAIAFGLDNPGEWLGCQEIRAAFRLDVNEFRDNRTLQLRIEYMESDSSV
jgi:single-stranded-DNA-specific exonuclease